MFIHQSFINESFLCSCEMCRHTGSQGSGPPLEDSELSFASQPALQAVSGYVF